MNIDKKPTPTRGVAVTLDRVRYIRYSLATRRKLRETHGESILAGELSDAKLLSVLLMGFQGDDPTLTEDRLEDLIDLENLTTVIEAMTKALGGGTIVAAAAAANPPVPTTQVPQDIPSGQAPATT